MSQPGQFSLHINFLPALQAGKYRTSAQHTVTSPGQAPFASIDPLESWFEVTAPRFALPADQILSTFPPHRSAGAFGTRLPQIVLRRRTLPWERSTESGNAPPEIPWLVLVVLADGEAEFKTGIPVSECITPGVTLFQTRNDVEIGDAIKVSDRVVRTCFPTADEVQLLAHVRRVDLTDTELALGDDDGWLAVIVSNRLPQPGKSYGAYLISVERQLGNLGHSSFYSDQDSSPATVWPLEPYTTYPVLAHWSFACVGEGDFQSLMQGLDAGMLGTLPAPPPPGQPAPPPRPKRPEVLWTGHLGVDASTREGEAGRAWYRGPLIPFPGTRQKPDAEGRLPLLHTSDQARRVGPDGRENLALATAFEIGRLLALAEPSVVAALLLWRKEGLDAARRAALLGAQPVLQSLGVEDVDRGFAARAGLDVLLALGRDDARRLGAQAPAHEALTGAQEVLAAATTAMRGLAELTERDGDDFDVLRTAVVQAAATLAGDGPGNEGDDR